MALCKALCDLIMCPSYMYTCGTCITNISTGKIEHLHFYRHIQIDLYNFTWLCIHAGMYEMLLLKFFIYLTWKNILFVYWIWNSNVSKIYFITEGTTFIVSALNIYTLFKCSLLYSAYLQSNLKTTCRYWQLSKRSRCGLDFSWWSDLGWRSWSTIIQKPAIFQTLR